VRTAYEPDIDRDSDWRRDGLCKSDPDLWSSPLQKDIHRAQHICKHCPVMVQCRAEGEQTPHGLRLGTVWGGVYYSRRGMSDRRPADASPVRCGWCRNGR
jgi:hypothetical protein